jgi:hypothetical protein
MSELHRVDTGQPKIAPPADDLLSRKSLVFAHPDEVVDDQELTPGDKRSLLPHRHRMHLRSRIPLHCAKLPSGAVVRVHDIMAALKSLDLNEPLHEASVTFSQSFARRGSKPTARRRNLRPEDDDEPPPFAASARIPTAQNIPTACGFRHRQLVGDSGRPAAGSRRACAVRVLWPQSRRTCSGKRVA